MFRMLGLGGARCPRCDHKTGNDREFCAHCGLSLGAPRSEPVLRDNRWIPADDELAVYFGINKLSGLFNKVLRVPAATRAYILQGDKATEVPQGEYELESFFTRLNNLLRDQHAEILITRSAPLPVDFTFSDLHTAEYLKISARFTVAVRVENVPAFAQHFMTTPGAVTTLQLHDLLAPSVRQVAAEFIGGRSMRDMGKDPALRAQLDERLQSALRLRLADFGLAAVEVHTLALRHDKFDANRERIGSLWLVADERHVQLEHVKQLDELYNEEEWQALLREEQKMRTDYRRAELRQDAAVGKAELALQEAERMQAMRARELDLYARIAESNNRQAAIDKGAGAELAALEHELARKKMGRLGEAAAWEQVRQLAQIKLRTELEVAQQAAHEERQLAKQRFHHQLHMQQIHNQVAQALLVEDEAHRRALLQRLRQEELAAREREAQMEAEHHIARQQGLEFANAARKREAERVQEWEEQQHHEKLRAQMRELAREEDVKDAAGALQVAQVRQHLDQLRREGATQDALAQHEKLLRTIEADGVHGRQNQAMAHQVMLDQLAVDEQRQALAQREREAEWQRELRLREHEREAHYAKWKGEYDTLLAQQAHSMELAQLEVTRVETIGRLSDSGKLATAPSENAAVLVQWMKEQVRSGMSPDQLKAMAQVVGAENSVSPMDALRLVQEQVAAERSHRDAQEAKDRRHQLDLLQQQNATHAHALQAQMQLGVGIAQGVAQGVAGTPASALPPGMAGVQPQVAAAPAAAPAAAAASSVSSVSYAPMGTPHGQFVPAHVVSGQFVAAQSVLSAAAPAMPAPAASRMCAHGHATPASRPDAKFCAECGAPLPPVA
ncbi:hypothetical protein GCM10027277_01100 [Pseudoduganella ginsengisoli]|uniref:Band 7 domain-containing protein n=1 Tax=Pseudoduganella ginsengisoli TaxID=1462440 RepID=A0A6L6Q8L3_9BURK|nr:zinc ribbon domain-containing protein [Pseudoduganella ginsengisoli]MTW06223.1 hypothetical protein [Pseudoduganella ginsengisoli]